MSQVVSVHLQAEQVERLKRFARRLGKSQSETGALLIEEGMREAEFAGIEFRDTPIGRQACLKGSTLAVWEVILIAQDLEADPERTAAYFGRPVEWVRAALHYHEAYPTEIEQALADHRDQGYEKLKRLLPQMTVFEAPAATELAER